MRVQSLGPSTSVARTTTGAAIAAVSSMARRRAAFVFMRHLVSSGRVTGRDAGVPGVRVGERGRARGGGRGMRGSSGAIGGAGGPGGGGRGVRGSSGAIGGAGRRGGSPAGAAHRVNAGSRPSARGRRW